MTRWILAAPAGLLLAAGAALAHEADGGLAGDLTLSAHELWRYLHVVLLVFWLGPDVGIVIAGAHAANATLNAAQRAGAARMMRYYEIMPRVCTSLMLTVGGILTEQVGLEHPWWQMAGIYLLGPVWLGLTLAAYFGGNAGAGALAGRLEHALRIVLIVAVPVSVAYSTLTGRLAPAPYVGGKLLLFALVLLVGLLARRAFGPFLDGVRQLATAGASPALDASIAASYRRGRLLVFVTWAALLLAALMGVVQPGVPDEAVGGVAAPVESAP
jgi:hypothetical protein